MLAPSARLSFPRNYTEFQCKFTVLILSAPEATFYTLLLYFTFPVIILVFVENLCHIIDSYSMLFTAALETIGTKGPVLHPGISAGSTGSTVGLEIGEIIREKIDEDEGKQISGYTGSYTGGVGGGAAIGDNIGGHPGALIGGLIGALIGIGNSARKL